MYAVIKTGGKQYKVAAGEKLKIEQIPAEIGSEILLTKSSPLAKALHSNWVIHWLMVPL
jgi:ribosomal protein L21